MSVVLALSLLCGTVACATAASDSNALQTVGPGATERFAQRCVTRAAPEPIVRLAPDCASSRPWAGDSSTADSPTADKRERPGRNIPDSSAGDPWTGDPSTAWRGGRIMQQDNGNAGRDPWFASDKLRHFLTAFAVTGYAHAGLRALDVDRDASLAGGVVVSLAAGIGKEIHDVRVGRFFSVKDLVWDLAGTLIGAALVAQAR